MVRYLVFPDIAGARLDVALARLSGIPRRAARRAVAAGEVWLNGEPAHVLSRTVTTADVVDVIPGAHTLLPPPSLPVRLPLLHEDGWLAVVDKPAGLASQSPRRRRPGELGAHELLALQLALAAGRRQDVLLVHRLDRLTTGVLLFARQHEASRALARAWGSGAVDKRYLAVVVGAPPRPRLTVQAPIARDPGVPDRFRVDRRGRPARTEIALLASSAGLSLVAVRPATGRTHQVRVHLAHAGLPVAGDRRYGGGAGPPRPFLHAWRLTLPHPRHGATLRLEAPPPQDMVAFLSAHGLAADLTQIP